MFSYHRNGINETTTVTRNISYELVEPSMTTSSSFTSPGSPSSSTSFTTTTSTTSITISSLSMVLPPTSSKSHHWHSFQVGIQFKSHYLFFIIYNIFGPFICTYTSNCCTNCVSLLVLGFHTFTCHIH